MLSSPPAFLSNSLSLRLMLTFTARRPLPLLSEALRPPPLVFAIESPSQSPGRCRKEVGSGCGPRSAPTPPLLRLTSVSHRGYQLHRQLHRHVQAATKVSGACREPPLEPGTACIRMIGGLGRSEAGQPGSCFEVVLEPSRTRMPPLSEPPTTSQP